MSDTVGETPFFKSKFPIGIYILAFVFIISVMFLVYKGIPFLWSIFYSLTILIVGLSFYRHHFTIRLYEDFFKVNYFNLIRKQETIYYKSISGIETEDGQFLNLFGSFITTHNKIIIRYREKNQKKFLELKVVAGIKFQQVIEKLSGKVTQIH